MVKVFACDKLGECTIEKVQSGLTACRFCALYEAPPPSDHTAVEQQLPCKESVVARCDE